MGFDESVLFEIVCSGECTSWDGANQQINNYIRAHPDTQASLLKESLAIHAIMQYANFTPPTTRQLILRLLRQYDPELIEALPLKFDGASASQLLETLASAEKRYGMVIAGDVGTPSTLVEHLLAQNRALNGENEELRSQLMGREEVNAKLTNFVRAHETVVSQLYQTTATLQQVAHENRKLKSLLSDLPISMQEMLKVSESGSPLSSKQQPRQFDVQPGAATSSADPTDSAEMARVQERLNDCQKDLKDVREKLRADELERINECRDLQKQVVAAQEAQLKTVEACREALEKANTKPTSSKASVLDCGAQTVVTGAGGSPSGRALLRGGAASPNHTLSGTQSPIALSLGVDHHHGGRRPSSVMRFALETPEETAELEQMIADNEAHFDDDSPEGIPDDLVPSVVVKPLLKELREQNEGLRQRLVSAQAIIRDYENAMGSASSPRSVLSTGRGGTSPRVAMGPRSTPRRSTPAFR